MGEDTLAFLCSAQSVQVWQTIIGVSGRSDIGLLFFESGPDQGMHRLGVFLQTQMDQGRLRCADPTVAARHLAGLLEAETLMPCLFGALENPSPDYLREATRRALQVFFGGYGAEAGI